MNWFSRMFQPAAPLTLPEGAVVIDVRSPGEFAAGHVQGAINLPLSSFGEQIAKVAPDKAQPVVLCCQSGARSGAACRIMEQLGYQQVINGGSAGTLALQMARPIERS